MRTRSLTGALLVAALLAACGTSVADPAPGDGDAKPTSATPASNPLAGTPLEGSLDLSGADARLAVEDYLADYHGTDTEWALGPGDRVGDLSHAQLVDIADLTADGELTLGESADRYAGAEEFMALRDEVSAQHPDLFLSGRWLTDEQGRGFGRLYFAGEPPAGLPRTIGEAERPVEAVDGPPPPDPTPSDGPPLMVTDITVTPLDLGGVTALVRDQEVGLGEVGYRGRVAIDGGCLALQAGGETSVIVWPPGTVADGDGVGVVAEGIAFADGDALTAGGQPVDATVLAGSFGGGDGPCRTESYVVLNQLAAAGD